jgi:hypothetical protein
MRTLYLVIPLAPLVGSLLAGLGGRWIGIEKDAEYVKIALERISKA